MEEGQDCGVLGRVLGLLRWEDVCSSPSLGLGPFLKCTMAQKKKKTGFREARLCPQNSQSIVTVSAES